MLKRTGFYVALLVLGVVCGVALVMFSHVKYNAFCNEQVMVSSKGLSEGLNENVGALEQLQALPAIPPAAGAQRFSMAKDYPVGFSILSSEWQTVEVLMATYRQNEFVIIGLVLTNLITILALIINLFEVRQLARRLPPPAASPTNN